MSIQPWLEYGNTATATMEWNNDLVIQLIKEYKNKRELWDSSCDSYRVHTAKFDAWQDLATMFDCEIIDIKRKMNSLFASHRRERAKCAHGCKSNWYAYSYMKFLKSRCSELKDDDTNDDVEIHDDSVNQNSDSETSEQHGPANAKSEPADKRKVRQPIIRERLQRNKLHKRRLLIPSSATARSDDSRILEALRALHKPEKKRDECDIFGEYIANALRKHDQRTRAMIKHAMNNILFESEMKKYNVQTNYQHVEINLTEETNPLILPDQNNEPMAMEEGIMSEVHEDLGAQKLETIDNSYAN